MNPREIYNGSDGAATQALYDRLATFGAIGQIALNLFRASKCSGRAKVYRGRGFKGDAYDRKNWSLENLNKALLEHAEILGLEWGWGKDDRQPVHNKVLYIDLPTGQVSFHSSTHFNSPVVYPGAWDGSGDSENRIIQFVKLVIDASEHTCVAAARRNRVEAVQQEQLCFIIAIRQSATVPATEKQTPLALQ